MITDLQIPRVPRGASMRPPELRVHLDGLIVDSFAGGGGASLGIEWATGRGPDIAINHDPEAIAMHAANHPDTRHFGLVLVMIGGWPYVIVDITLRMLWPHELFAATGFPRTYIINPFVTKTLKSGKVRRARLSKTAQVAKCGNAVPPDLAAAVAGAQFGHELRRLAA